jgi:hypothetical protein
MIFRGWVPTITGNLSFSTIGIGRNPKKIFKTFRAVQGVHFAVVAQKRRTSDALLGWFGDFLNWFSNTQGHTIYIFFGRCTEDDGYSEMSGPCVELPLSEYRRLEGKLSALDGQLTDEQFNHGFMDAVDTFCSAADSPAGVLSSIVLQRNGAVEIEVSATAGNSFENQKLNASQVYFFLRDVCHVHQHHAPTSDTILDVTDCTTETNAWKRETLYSLYRWVIQQKRAKSVSSFINAKGVLAYAHTFEQTHGEETSDYSRDYFREATVESIQAGLESAAHLSKQANRFSNALFNRVIPAIAFLLAVVAPWYSLPDGYLPSVQQQLVAEFADLISRNLLTVCFGTLGVLVLYNLIVIYGRQILVWSFSLDLLRLVLMFRFWVVVLSVLALAIFALGVAIALFYLQIVPEVPTSVHPTIQ